MFYFSPKKTHSNHQNFQGSTATASSDFFGGFSTGSFDSQDFGAYSSQVTRAEKTPQEWSDMIDLMTKSWASEDKTTEKQKKTGQKDEKHYFFLGWVDMECFETSDVLKFFDLEFNFVNSRHYGVCWFVKVVWSWWVAIKKGLPQAQQTHKGCEGCVNRIDEEKTTLCHT